MRLNEPAVEKCEKANGYMMKYMDGEISEKEAGWLRDHINDCSSCKADFDLYDFIFEKFSKEAGLTPAPAGFTQAVMNKLAALPSPMKVAAAAFDRLVYGVWGVFSILFGLGFLLVLNRDRVMEYLTQITWLNRYITAITPISERINETLVSVVTSVSGAFTTALMFVSDYRYVVFGVCIFLVGGQLLVARRKMAAKD